jgi:hypothetical protein
LLQGLVSLAQIVHYDDASAEPDYRPPNRHCPIASADMLAEHVALVLSPPDPGLRKHMPVGGHPDQCTGLVDVLPGQFDRSLRP